MNKTQKKPANVKQIEPDPEEEGGDFWSNEQDFSNENNGSKSATASQARNTSSKNSLQNDSQLEDSDDRDSMVSLEKTSEDNSPTRHVSAKSQKSQSSTVNVAMAFHSTAQANANLINEHLKEINSNLNIVMLTESVPHRIQTRLRLVEQSDCMIVLVGCNFQKNSNCIELTQYAVSLDKQMYPVNFFYSYTPFGALGLLLGQRDLIRLSPEDTKQFCASLDELTSEISSLESGGLSKAEFSDMDFLQPDANLKFVDSRLR